MDESGRSALLAFVARFVADRREGRVAPLADYLARFPGAEREVAAEYLRARDNGGPAGDGGPESADPDERRIADYRLERELGRGGQGVVWLASDTRLTRQVALKVIPLGTGSTGPPPRLLREALATASLEHPAFCTVYDVGADEHSAWIAMRYVEGVSLGEWADARRDSPDFLRQLLILVGEVARALHFAHQAGVVHRDVKPSNVLVTADDQVVVLDLGVALLEQGAAPLTLTGDALGTPAYIAPEALISTEGRAGPQADVWGLGVTLYQTLSGRLPFDAPTRAGITRAILDEEPEDLRRLGVPRDPALVVHTCLHKELDQRYRDAGELADELERAAQGSAVRARPIGPLSRVARWSRRNPRFAGTIAVFAVLLTAVAVVSLALYLETSRTLKEKEELVLELSQSTDHVLVRQLLADERRLWPAVPQRLQRIDQWLTDARGLLGRESSHRVQRAQLVARLEQFSEVDSGSLERADDAWKLSKLDELLASVVDLPAALERVEARRLFASELERRTVTDHAEAWARAVRGVSEDPRFAGFALTPQVGLIPLGSDPLSGLQEFAHLASGPPARRRTGGSEIVCEEGRGLVLILVPGGNVQSGAVLEGPGRVDPLRSEWEVGLLEHRLEPFLISKYEMTQEQWQRHTGKNPAAYGQSHPLESRRRPVEQVGWAECRTVLGQLDLALPSEARWEHAARSGTESIWYTGDEVTSIRGHANLADATAKEMFVEAHGETTTPFEDWLTDGSYGPSRVGTYDPNPFGLHDVMGNVAEWTTGGQLWPGDSESRRERGEAQGDPYMAIARGGSFQQLAPTARSAAREGYSTNATSPRGGVRPVRSLRSR